MAGQPTRTGQERFDEAYLRELVEQIRSGVADVQEAAARGCEIVAKAADQLRPILDALPPFRPAPPTDPPVDRLSAALLDSIGTQESEPRLSGIVEDPSLLDAVLPPGWEATDPTRFPSTRSGGPS